MEFPFTKNDHFGVDIALCHPFIIVLRRNEHGDPPWFYLLVIGIGKTFFKEKKSWIVEVVVFICK